MRVEIVIIKMLYHGNCACSVIVGIVIILKSIFIKLIITINYHTHTLIYQYYYGINC